MVYSNFIFGIVCFMEKDFETKCIRCEANIDQELVYCFKCGSPHHRKCFEEYRQCAKSACKVTVYVANDGSGTVECLNLPASQKVKKQDVETAGGQETKEPTMLEMTAALLFAFAIFVVASVLLQAR